MTTQTAPAQGRTMRKERPAPQKRSVERRRPDGEVLGTVILPPEFFGIDPNVAVMHQVVTAQLAAARAGTHSTRTRSEVRGGGAKPYKQKGTGRARQGSTRAPQWAGGGVALGPKPHSYRQRTPKKMVRLALCSALSDRAAQGKVVLVDAWGFDAPRTKDAAESLGALEVAGKALVVLDAEDRAAAFSFRNLPDVHIIATGELNAYDVLRHDWVVFTDTTLPGGPPEMDEAAPRPAKRAAKTTAKAAKATKASKATEAAADAEPAVDESAGSAPDSADAGETTAGTADDQDGGES